MSGVDYKQSYAWRESLTVSQEVFGLIETLPETAGPLAAQLAELSVGLPAGVAADLMAGREAGLDAIVRLMAAVELVDRIYPALDTGKVQKLTARLMDRLQSPTFIELVPTPHAADAREEEETPEEVEVAESDEPVEFEEDEEPTDAITSVRVHEES
jgi:hypothetical protein